EGSFRPGGRSMQTRLFLAAAGILILATAAPVIAHHAFTSEFDGSKPVTLKGTVTKMEWINPHAWLHIDVKGPDGKVVAWMIEGVKCAVALVCTRWQAVFLRPSDPADLVLIASFASWTCVFHSLRFGPLRVEISLIHGHIISRCPPLGRSPGICGLVLFALECEGLRDCDDRCEIRTGGKSTLTVCRLFGTWLEFFAVAEPHSSADTITYWKMRLSDWGLSSASRDVIPKRSFISPSR